MVQTVNGLIKINKDLQIDFSFIDKILQNMSIINKDQLLEAIKKVGITQAYDKVIKGNIPSISGQ